MWANRWWQARVGVTEPGAATDTAELAIRSLLPSPPRRLAASHSPPLPFLALPPSPVLPTRPRIRLGCGDRGQCAAGLGAAGLSLSGGLATGLGAGLFITPRRTGMG